MHNLMGHMHLHSDSKPFKCLYCPSKFTLKGNLTRHMKVKHGVMDRGLDERCKDAQKVKGIYISKVPYRMHFHIFSSWTPVDHSRKKKLYRIQGKKKNNHLLFKTDCWTFHISVSLWLGGGLREQNKHLTGGIRCISIYLENRHTDISDREYT